MSSISKITIEYQGETIEISRKHDEFCYSYALHINSATYIYSEIYNSENKDTARKEASKLLKQNHIQKTIRYYQSQIAEKIKDKRDEALIRLYTLSQIATDLDPIKQFHEDSKTYKALEIIDPQYRKLLKIKSQIDDDTGLLEATEIINDNTKFLQESFNKMLIIHGITKDNQATDDHIEFTGVIDEN